MNIKYKMNINKVSLKELKNNSREYARKYKTDELLDALNLCEQDKEKKQAIIEILKIQQENEQQINNEWLNNKEQNDKLNLSTLIEKFHNDIDSYSLKHRLIESWVQNPELSFKLTLLKYSTLLLEGEELSEEENDIFEDFNIDTTDFALLDKLTVELKLDLKRIYSIKTGNFIDISSNEQIQGILHLSQEVNNKSIMKYANGRLNGKKFIPWHRAFYDSPSKVKLHDEDVVEYNLWDEYIPVDNHSNSIELINKLKTASIEELEKMYLEYNGDLEHHKKYNNKCYILALKESILNYEGIDLLNMYKSGDRFMVVKATYKDKYVYSKKYINCWYVDIYSEKTKKIYRALSI